MFYLHAEMQFIKSYPDPHFIFILQKEIILKATSSLDKTSVFRLNKILIKTVSFKPEGVEFLRAGIII